MHVLVVDDDNQILASVEELLRLLGHSTLTVPNFPLAAGMSHGYLAQAAEKGTFYWLHGTPLRSG